MPGNCVYYMYLMSIPVYNSLRDRSLVIPREKGILFSVCLSVCLSVCPSVCLSVCPGRSFSHFVRVTPPTVFITQTKPIPSESWTVWTGSGGPFFRTPPPKFRRNRSLMTAQNHKFQFFERHKSKSIFGLRTAMHLPYTCKSPASIV